MNKFKMILITVFFIGLTFICTGCANDDMQDINIIVTNYPNEYIVSKLYGDYSKITSVYPDGVKTEEYGAATQVWVRVWLEGEDTKCNNETYASLTSKSWKLDLDFSFVESTDAVKTSVTNIGSVA